MDLIPPTLGYTARADVLLEQTEPPRRIWVEFEVSRADPVANHAKFATAHLFDPQLPSDCFVSMVSPHVTRGRRNLAANTIHLMRLVGMRAYQTSLFPRLTPAEIQRLNQSPAVELSQAGLLVEPELERIMSVVNKVAAVSGVSKTYCAINDGPHIMDGHRARVHLADRLGMVLRSPAHRSDLADRFSTWLGRHPDSVRVDVGGLQFLVLPEWYGGLDSGE